jgi:hypothetical protein
MNDLTVVPGSLGAASHAISCDTGNLQSHFAWFGEHEPLGDATIESAVAERLLTRCITGCRIVGDCSSDRRFGGRSRSTRLSAWTRAGVDKPVTRNQGARIT